MADEAVPRGVCRTALGGAHRLAGTVGPRPSALGEWVFIQGGAGGVGSLAVHLAKAQGANVTATANAEDEPLVRALGADEVLPSVAEGLAPGDQPFDVLVDTFGGGQVPAESYGLLRPGGRLATLAQPLDQLLADAHGIRGIFFVVSPNPDELRHLPTWQTRGSCGQSSLRRSP